jgi:hypothetical protein
LPRLDFSVGDGSIDLATSRYQAKDLILASGLVPVGITISPPRFPLGYECVYMTRLAPWGLRELDDDEFTRRYRDRLDGIGIAAIWRRFLSISNAHDGRGLCFLCYEPAGAFCHRRVLARFIEDATLQPVPELAVDQLGLF